jgi:hypothetical protein
VTLKWLLTFAAMTAIAAQHGRTPVDQPEAQAKSEPRQSESSTRSLAGNATWYAYHQGQAAAGPGLRKWLGKDWRGMSVEVCAQTDCVTVRLTDWCLCSRGNRLIDLDNDDFKRLGALSTGVLPITIGR